MKDQMVVVAGGGGFIGGSLVGALRQQGSEGSAPWISSRSISGISASEMSRICGLI
jgi:nucleoside-diphosphate-sugar epimerase